MRGDAEGAPKGAMAVTYRLSRDWSYEERRRRLQRVYGLLLGLAPWPGGDAPDREQHEEDRGA